jgi:ATP-dependent RNA helicase RhlE
VCVDELKLLRDIEKLLGQSIEKINLPGYDIDPSIKAEPIVNGRGGGGRNNGGNRGSNARGRGRAGSSGARGDRNGGSRARSGGGNQRAG